jgi:AMP-binding enzyme
MTTHVHPDRPRPVWQGLDGLRGNHAVALQYDTRLGMPPTIRLDLLAPRALQIASGLHSAGVRRGELVSLLLPPGPARTAVAYACWRIGAVVVATSTELTLRGVRTGTPAGPTGRHHRQRARPRPHPGSALAVAASRGGTPPVALVGATGFEPAASSSRTGTTSSLPCH